MTRIVMSSPRMLRHSSRAGSRLVSMGLAVAVVAALAPMSMSSAAEESAQAWTQIGSYTPPIVRSNHGMAFDAERGEMIMYGGSGPTNANVTLGDTWVFDGSRWTERQPATSPPDRRSAAMAYDPVRKEVVLFSGLGSGGPLADTWTWDGATWTERHPVHAPPARSVAEMAWDPVSERLVLFGGYNSATFLGFADTWTWDGSDWTQEDAVAAPPPRWGFGFADGGPSSGPVLFGGTTGLPGMSMLNDTWTWDGAAGAWEPHVGPSLPGPRTGLQMAYDPSIGKTVMFGGLINSPYAAAGESGVTAGTQQWFTDIWAFDGNGWSELDQSSSRQRVYGAMEYDSVNSRMVVFGGVIFEAGVASGKANDTWALRGSQWQQLDLNAPDELAAAMIAREPSGTAILYGGVSEYSAASDRTWRWSHDAWELLAPAHSPPARSGAAMILNPSSNEVVLFGGSRAGSNAADTWTWDGTDWTERHPTRAPSPRASASIAYDAASGHVVLFGGYDDGGFALSDTWVWDGTTWTEMHPVDAPPARAGAAMTYDPQSGRVVLFGGVMSKTEGWYEDTWSWGGGMWIEEHPAASPSPRAYAAMGFDPASGRPILYGGTWGDAYAHNSFGDTWTYEPGLWTKLAAAQGPYRRSHVAVADGQVWTDADGTHSLPMLLFGGARATFDLDGSPAEYVEGTGFGADLWAFNDPTATPCTCHRYGASDAPNTVVDRDYGPAAKTPQPGWALRNP